MTQDIDLWFFRKRKADKEQVKYRLFLFPPAGGDGSTYLHWEEKVPDFVETCFLKLPGRGPRILEPAIDNIDELTEQIADAIEPYTDLPFLFFGHSMGGLIAYGLTQKMQERNLTLPKRIIISSIKAPNYMNKFTESLTNDNDDKLYKKSDEEFLARISELGGIPQVLLETRELLDLILPTFKSDIKLCETYDPDSAKVLDVPFDVFGGNKDVIATKEELNGWKSYTSQSCSITVFPGNHFYFIDNPNILLFQICSRLNDMYLDVE